MIFKNISYIKDFMRLYDYRYMFKKIGLRKISTNKKN